MARFTKMQVLNAIQSTGMVSVFYHKDIEVSKRVLKACYDGGVRAFEFTNRGDFASEVFIQLVKYAENECPDMILGIGSIVDAPTAALYMQYGANFIVGPTSMQRWRRCVTVTLCLTRPDVALSARSDMRKS